MEIYDISQEVFSCAVYPGDPAPERFEILKKSDGAVCNLTAFKMCAHNGTHVDAPHHFLDHAQTIDQIDLRKMIGYAYVAEHDGPVTVDDAKRILAEAKQAEQESGVPGCDAAKRILVKGKATLTDKAACIFCEAGILLYGNESQTVGPEDAPLVVHLAFLDRGIVPLEGIRLGAVDRGVYLLHAAPINLGGSDGAPCRATLLKL